jgi:hypothetical protein
MGVKALSHYGIHLSLHYLIANKPMIKCVLKAQIPRTVYSAFQVSMVELEPSSENLKHQRSQIDGLFFFEMLFEGQLHSHVMMPGPWGSAPRRNRGFSLIGLVPSR